MLLSYTGDGTPAWDAFASGGYVIAVYMAEMLGHYIDFALIQQKKAMNINLLLKGPGLWLSQLNPHRDLHWTDLILDHDALS